MNVRQYVVCSCGFAFLALALSAHQVHAQHTSATKLPTDARLKNAIEPMLREHRGEVGLAIRNLQTAEHYEFQADTPMATASLIKFPMLVTTYRLAESGQVDLRKRIVLQEKDKVPGSGELTKHFSAGNSLPLVDYVRLMIRHSDNTATNIVAREIGLRATADDMTSLGFTETKLHSFLYRGGTSVFPERSRKYGIGSTTANEMVGLLAQLESGSLVSAEATSAMREHLLACDDETKLARDLNGLDFAHKTGEIANCRTDAGILYTKGGPVAVCFLTDKNEDQSFDEDNPAHLLAGRVGQAIVERFGSLAIDPTLQEGTFGKVVEALQRTLNDRLTPSPQLAIDGDFGPATRRAVELFQRSRQLPISGKVTSETWKALGTLIEQDEPVPPPEVANSQELPRIAQKHFADPPYVTCKAWAIFDVGSRKLLFENNASTPLEGASTTKVMTAYLVCQLAAEEPAVLDEKITFSQRADDTPGSTAGLRVGEQVSVRELLYGLLLPSGNDASVAFAEHFGARVMARDLDSDPDRGSYDRFILAMNQAAKQLHLEAAHYLNPHGLPDTEHVISARDLGVLSLAALESELFRDVVATRQFGCVASSVQGYTRNVLWKNTNQLLGTEGFSGVKTGTTSAAGACLVSLGERDGDALLVVTLGSTSTESRYADTQNLFRWAWQKRSGSGAE